MNIALISGIVAAILGAYSTIPYVIAILKKKTRPHQLSWLVFTIMNGIVFFSQFFAGARLSVIITAIFFVGSILIFLLSLKYGTRKSSRWDKTLFGIAIVTIAVWYLTRNNDLAIWLTVIIDLAASTMIIFKLRTQPDSESAQPWIIATVAYIFTCISLMGTPFGILYVRPLYGLVCDAALVFFIFLYMSKSKTKPAPDSPAKF